MKSLQDRIANLKYKITQAEAQDKELKETCLTVIRAILGVSDIQKIIKEIYKRRRVLVIITSRKVYAQELFLHKERILQNMRSFHVQEIKII